MLKYKGTVPGLRGLRHYKLLDGPRANGLVCLPKCWWEVMFGCYRVQIRFYFSFK